VWNKLIAWLRKGVFPVTDMWTYSLFELTDSFTSCLQTRA